jgi:Transposase DDE domain
MTATDSTGRRLPKRVLRQPPATPDGAINLTDPDTQMMMGHKQFVQGYNAQAVVSEDQIVLAAEISTRPGDFSHLRPMLVATHQELEQAAIGDRPKIALADAGFWNEEHMDDLAAQGITELIPPDAGNRKGERPGWTGGRYSWMRHVLRPRPAPSSTENAGSRSSRCSVRPSTTANSLSSTDADAAPCAPNGDY